MNIYTFSRALVVFALVFNCLGIEPVNSDSADGKKASDVYLEYLASAQKASSFGNISSYWAGWMAESFGRGSDEQKAARFERLKKSANDKKDVKVVSTEKSGEFWIINLSSVYPDGQMMKGQVKIILENHKYLIEEEMWTADFSGE